MNTKVTIYILQKTSFVIFPKGMNFLQSKIRCHQKDQNTLQKLELILLKNCYWTSDNEISCLYDKQLNQFKVSILKMNTRYTKFNSTLWLIHINIWFNVRIERFSYVCFLRKWRMYRILISLSLIINILNDWYKNLIFFVSLYNDKNPEWSKSHKSNADVSKRLWRDVMIGRV